MTIAMDQKDLNMIDEEFAADSKIWQPLTGGAKSITAADFTGVLTRCRGLQKQKFITVMETIHGTTLTLKKNRLN